MLAAFAFLPPPEPTEPAVSVFPLPQRYAGNYGNDWGAARIQGDHEGTDIFAPAGTVIRSITAGTVSRAWGSSSGDGWNNLGGYTVMIEASENVGTIQRGDRLYYAHMDTPTKLEPGDTVEAGDKIGAVGDTGQGPPGTRGEFEPHLHLGWYEGWSFFGEDRTSAINGAMNPHPMLKRVERESESGGGKNGAWTNAPSRELPPPRQIYAADYYRRAY